MCDPNDTYLNRFSDGAIQVSQGIIEGLNQAAQAHFPILVVGMKLPSFLAAALSDPDGTGTFSHNNTLYIFSLVRGVSHTLVLFRPAPQTALSNRQLDGFIRQMRTFLQDIMMEFQMMSHAMTQDSISIQDHMDAFSKSFCRVYRLLGNLEFMRCMGSPEGVSFHPVTMDLVGFCLSLSREAGDLLGEAGIQLRFQCSLSSLLVPADPELLRKLLLTLLSNAALSDPGGVITLTLSSRQNRAILILGDRGRSNYLSLDVLRLEHLSATEIPTPRSGAGMGISIAQHIVSLHHGSMLVEQPKDQGLMCIVALPLSPLLPRLPVQSPKMEDGLGLSSTLVELADVLPLSLFRDE